MANNEEQIRQAHDFENLNIEDLGNTEEQRKLRELEDLMLHASQCRSPSCQHTDCRNVKGVSAMLSCAEHVLLEGVSYAITCGILLRFMLKLAKRNPTAMYRAAGT